MRAILLCVLPNQLGILLLPLAGFNSKVPEFQVLLWFVKVKRWMATTMIKLWLKIFKVFLMFVWHPLLLVHILDAYMSNTDIMRFVLLHNKDHKVSRSSCIAKPFLFC